MGILEFSRESERMAEIGILKIHIENNEIEDSPLQCPCFFLFFFKSSRIPWKSKKYKEKGNNKNKKRNKVIENAIKTVLLVI